MTDTIPSEAEDSLDQLFADYLEAVESGRPFDIPKFLAQHPELARAVAAHEDLGRLAAPVRGILSTASLHASPEDSPLPPGTRMENYEVLEVIGRGGMGIVYKARDHEFGIAVALKMLLAGPRAGERETQRFIETTKNLAELRHPNIVKVHTGGKHEGRLYFTMDLIEGGDLTRMTSGQPTLTREAVSLMIKIARAVHHAHQREILHRDLKPSNILVDPEGEPYVADFGLAKQLQRAEPEHRQYMVGAPAFIAPEQIEGRATVLSDVYGLGTIFYWLLTAQRPFSAATVEDTLQMVRAEEPTPPHVWNPQLSHRLNHHLELICLKCLEKEPERRYPSADSMALDLERWLEGKPPLHVMIDRVDRVWLWLRRNRVLAALMLIAAALLLMLIAMTVTVSRARAARLEKWVLTSNAYAAEGVGSTFLIQFREWASTINEVSREAERLIEQNDLQGLQQFLERAYQEASGERFEAWVVLNWEGRYVASSDPGEDKGKFEFRDYFRGALTQANRQGVDSVYVSRAYRSTHDGLYKIALARALRNPIDPDHPWVLVGPIKTDKDMGMPQLHDQRQKAALVVPEDPNPNPSPQLEDETQRYLIMLHHQYTYGQDPIELPSKTLGPLLEARGARQLSAKEKTSTDPCPHRIANYRDPVCEGRWLAAIAPVGTLN